MGYYNGPGWGLQGTHAPYTGDTPTVPARRGASSHNSGKENSRRQCVKGLFTVEGDVTPAKSKPHEIWLRDQLAPLVRQGEFVQSVLPEITHEYGWHTGLKLAAFRHATDLFSTIAHSWVHDKGIYRKSVYLDLFAGCGLNRLPNGDVLAGSPFIGISAAGSFDQIVLVEQRSDYFAALRARLALERDNRVQALEADCNSAVDQVVERVGERNSMVLTVLDQETLQARWATVRAISEAFPALDIVLTLPTGIERVVAAARVSGRDSPTIRDSTGVTVAQVIQSSGGSGTEALKKQIREILGRRHWQASLVRDVENRPLYELHVFTRETRGGSPYWRGYEALAERLSHLPPQAVEGAINDIKGRGLGVVL